MVTYAGERKPNGKHLQPVRRKSVEVCHFMAIVGIYSLMWTSTEYCTNLARFRTAQALFYFPGSPCGICGARS
jgi:hypothetical protein